MFQKIKPDTSPAFAAAQRFLLFLTHRGLSFLAFGVIPARNSLCSAHKCAEGLDKCKAVAVVCSYVFQTQNHPIRSRAEAD
jgi:hypothetical protein